MTERPSLRRRAVEAYRRGGLRDLYCGALAVTIYRRLAVFVRSDPDAPSYRSRELLSFRFLADAGLGDYLALRPDACEAEVHRRLRAGHRCLMAYDAAGRAVGATWSSVGVAELEYLGLSFALADAYSFTFDAYTLPEARHMDIGSSLSAEMRDRFRAEGRTQALIAILPENRGGMRITRRTAIPVGTVGCLRLGPWRLPLRRLPGGYLGEASRFRPAC